MDKKFVMGIAAMAALTLVSCSSDDLDSVSDNSSKNEAISFDGYLGRSAVAVNGTRGSVETVDNLKTDGFGVFGNYSATESENSTFGTNLFNNVKVTGTTSTEGTNNVTKWTYGDVKYWPTKGQIDFLAYAPHETEKTLTSTSCIDFTVGTKAADQKDLLWANAKKQTIKTIANTDNKVKFHFDHALSRLGYSVKLKEKCSSDATIKLNKITLAGSATEPTTGAFYPKGTIDLSKSSPEDPWTSKENVANSKLKFDWDYSSNPLVLSEVKKENADNEYLFVIPQNFSGADQLYVIVEYTMQYTDVKGSDGQPAIITNTVHKKLTQDFKQGKAYTINLTIGRPIEFDADVTPWVDDTNTNTDINIDSWE